MKIKRSFSIQTLAILTALAAIPSVIIREHLKRYDARNRQLELQWKLVDEMGDNISFGLDFYNTGIEVVHINANLSGTPPVRAGDKRFDSEVTMVGVEQEADLEALEKVANLPFLDSMYLDKSNLTQDFCERVGRCSKLKYFVTPAWCDLEGFGAISKAPKLVYVSIRVSQADLTAVQEIAKRQGFHLDANVISQAQLSATDSGQSSFNKRWSNSRGRL